MVFFLHPKAALKNVDIGAAIFKNASVQFSTLALARLEEKGVLFARLEDLEAVKSYSAAISAPLSISRRRMQNLLNSIKGFWNISKGIEKQFSRLARIGMC